MNINESRLVYVAQRRIRNILRQREIATMRMLEQKISDAGPFDQRVDPHILTEAMQMLVRNGVVIKISRDNITWYRLASMPKKVWTKRLEKLEPILKELHGHSWKFGKPFEVAVYRALLAGRKNLSVIGYFEHLDTLKPKKIEPPKIMVNGNLTRRTLDFLLIHPTAGMVGIEVKNTREWLYPNNDLMYDFLSKCCELDAVPVMICRRYAYVTYSILNRCGVLLYQNYNQLMPESLRTLSEKVRHKDLIGYHDIRVGDQPNQRLQDFIVNKLPVLLPDARARFSEYRDLLDAFASRDMDYKEFVARSKRREEGIDEDWGNQDPYV